MKRLIAMLLMATLLAVPALAEEDGTDLSKWVVPARMDVKLDLDGDGAEETLYWNTVGLDEYESRLILGVGEGDKVDQEYETYIYSSEAVLAVDLDGDGIVEILLTGDEASDDYITICLHWTDGALVEVPFADGSRGENTDEYQPQGYGYLTAIDGNTLTLLGSQDVLGTWFAERTYALNDGQFDFADDGEWKRDMGAVDLNDEGYWAENYSVLTTTAPLTYTGEDGVEAELPVGAKLIITGSDKTTYARFVASDGAAGTLAIAPDEENGWGMLVNGVPEGELFEYIPYAD